MSGDRVRRNITIKYRLYPTPEQAALFEKTFSCCRWIWNAILADEQEFFAAADRHYLPTPAKYKKGAPFLKEADSQALITAHQNLRRAFQDFFDGKSATRSSSASAAATPTPSTATTTRPRRTAST